MSEARLCLGDCREVMAGMEPDSIDSVVTDPPYGLAFMGKDWDHGVPGVAFWQEALRVAKPGAHLLAFGGTRTFHRLAVAIEDAGWEIRDTVMWVYGSGFPKSHNVSKAIDKAAGAERPDALSGGHKGYATSAGDVSNSNELGTLVPHTIGKGAFTNGTPATDAARQWDGWGTALKPAWEPIIVARKPFSGTVAANVLAWGTGAINVDGCRVPTDEAIQAHHGTNGGNGHTMGARNEYVPGTAGTIFQKRGRWPANVIHDGSDEVVGLFPVTTTGIGNKRNTKPNLFRAKIHHRDMDQDFGGDTGSASRFFPALPLDAEDVETARVMYCAKASKADRDEGCEGLEERPSYMVENGSKTSGKDGARYDRHTVSRNHHPTVKPTALMRWLVRLVTRPGGVVLDPFMGSGSTGKAAALEGMQFVGIEQDAEYLEIARRRIEAVRLPLLEAVHEFNSNTRIPEAEVCDG